VAATTLCTAAETEHQDGAAEFQQQLFFLKSRIRLHVEIQSEEFTLSFYWTVHVSPLLTFFSSVSALFPVMTWVQCRLVYQFLHSNTTQSELVMDGQTPLLWIKTCSLCSKFPQSSCPSSVSWTLLMQYDQKEFWKETVSFYYKLLDGSLCLRQIKKIQRLL